MSPQYYKGNGFLTIAHISTKLETALNLALRNPFQFLMHQQDISSSLLSKHSDYTDGRDEEKLCPVTLILKLYYKSDSRSYVFLHALSHVGEGTSLKEFVDDNICIKYLLTYLSS